MAAIPVDIQGTITTASPKGEVDPSGKQQCIISGVLSLSGLSVGGGPVIPPDQPPPDVTPPDPQKPWEAKTFWTPENGWQVVLVPAEGTNVPTPSRRK
jgi:hypothetical protein